MLSPNAKNLVFDSVGSFDTVTSNAHVAVRLRESVAVHVTVVVPIGKLEPDPGEQVTLTVPWPAVAVGASKSSVIPPGLIVERDTASPHVNAGASATGGGGGGGVGAVGVLLQPDASATMMNADAKQERIAQGFTNLMNMN
jgi:hypothetical protein